MTSPLRFALGLTLLALPLVEIALLIKASATWGLWTVFGMILATALAGIATIRTAGLSAISRLFSHVQAGGNPFASMLEEALRLTGGVLLVLPGLLGDAIGALLLVPAVRRQILRAVGTFVTAQTVGDGSAGQRRPSDPWTQGPSAHGPSDERRHTVRTTTIIEGEYTRLDDERP